MELETRLRTNRRAIIAAIIWQAIRDCHNRDDFFAREAADWLLTDGYTWWCQYLGLEVDDYNRLLDQCVPAHL